MTGKVRHWCFSYTVVFGRSSRFLYIFSQCVTRHGIITMAGVFMVTVRYSDTLQISYESLNVYLSDLFDVPKMPTQTGGRELLNSVTRRCNGVLLFWMKSEHKISGSGARLFVLRWRTSDVYETLCMKLCLDL